MKNEELEKVLAVAEQWTKEPYDAETRAAVKAMIEAEDKTELIDSFYRTLEFGTGGLRGLMGPGTNRMNKYIVAQATQGYANYLLKVQKEGSDRRRGVCFDKGRYTCSADALSSGFYQFL